MPTVNQIQTAFTGGEFSPKLLARVDLAKYASGAEQLENFIVMPWGGLRKRGGTKFIGNTKDNGQVRLQRFVFSVTQSYMLEFGVNYIRIHTQDATLTEAADTITGATQANPVVITAANTYSNGDRVIITGVSGMVELNNREFTVASAAAGSFALSGIDGTAFTAYSSGGSSSEIIEVSTPYGASDLAALDFTQSADQLYIAHADHQPRILSRNSATSWTLATADIENGPFRDINTDDSVTVFLTGGSVTGYGTYAEGSTGATMTASSSLFTADHIGSLWRLYQNNEGSAYSPLVGGSTTIVVNRLYENAGNVYAVTASTEATFNLSTPAPTHTRGTVQSFVKGDTARTIDWLYVHDGSVIVKVTGFTSDTVVEITIVRNDAPAEVIGSGNASSFWEEGAFSVERGWPGKISFYEERLWFARSASQPQTVWASRTGAFLDFLDGDDDDRALVFTISSEQVDAIQWINGGRVLSLGTTDGEYIASAETTTKPLTPGDITIRRQTGYGSADSIPAQRVGDVVLFAQRYGDTASGARVVREHSYQFENDSYLGRNITILSDHVTGLGITEFAYQASPWSLVWARRSDGELAALTYERDQEVLAWHRHIVGGVSDGSSSAAIVETMDAIPGDVGDDLWIVAQRWVNGGLVRDIERTTIGLDDDGAITASQFLDAHLVYSGASVSTINGLYHLRGETVRVFHDGADQGTVTVSATGSVTLGSSVTSAVIGYGYTAKVLTLRVEAGIASGTAQGKRKRLSEITLRVYQSSGGAIGGNSTRTDSLNYSLMETGFVSGGLSTGDIRMEFPDGWGYDGRTYIEHSVAEPFVPVGLIAEVRGSG